MRVDGAVPYSVCELMRVDGAVLYSVCELMRVDGAAVRPVGANVLYMVSISFFT